MNDKTRTEFILLFNQGFEEVVLPEIISFEEKMDQGFRKVNSKLDNLERRLDADAIKLDDHENRIKKSESKRAVA